VLEGLSATPRKDQELSSRRLSDWLPSTPCDRRPGEGRGSRGSFRGDGEGLIAGRQVSLHLGSVASIVNDPEKQKLLKRKDEPETRSDDLKYRKAAVPRGNTSTMRSIAGSICDGPRRPGPMKLQSELQNALFVARGADRGILPVPARRSVSAQSPWMRKLRPRRPSRVAQAKLCEHGDAGAKACYPRVVDLQ